MPVRGGRVPQQIEVDFEEMQGRLLSSQSVNFDENAGHRFVIHDTASLIL